LDQSLRTAGTLDVYLQIVVSGILPSLSYALYATNTLELAKRMPKPKIRYVSNRYVFWLIIIKIISTKAVLPIHLNCATRQDFDNSIHADVGTLHHLFQIMIILSHLHFKMAD
jgi:hypothetical protein